MSTSIVNQLWKYSTIHKSACKVVDKQPLWGETVCRVWLPDKDAVVRVSASDLTEIAEFFDTMQEAHFAAVTREEERGMIAFASRRKAIDRLGLPEVRQFRLARLDEDESQWRSELKSARQIVPEMRPLVMLNIGNGAVCE